jgi:hypothetical protein
LQFQLLMTAFLSSFSDINHLLEVLRERKVARMKVNEGVLPQYGEMGQTLQNVSKIVECSKF